jgi:hypothetical protein
MNEAQPMTPLDRAGDRGLPRIPWYAGLEHRYAASSALHVALEDIATIAHESLPMA